MKGHVDQYGRAMLPVQIQGPAQPAPQTLEAWIDTAFTGEMYLPQTMIDQMKLPAKAKVRAELADGSHVEMTTFACEVNWFGQQRTVDVVAHPGKHALVGICLLAGKRLTIDYAGLTVELT